MHARNWSASHGSRMRSIAIGLSTGGDDPQKSPGTRHHGRARGATIDLFVGVNPETLGGTRLSNTDGNNAFVVSEDVAVKGHRDLQVIDCKPHGSRRPAEVPERVGVLGELLVIECPKHGQIADRLNRKWLHPETASVGGHNFFNRVSPRAIDPSAVHPMQCAAVTTKLPGTSTPRPPRRGIRTIACVTRLATTELIGRSGNPVTAFVDVRVIVRDWAAPEAEVSSTRSAGSQEWPDPSFAPQTGRGRARF